jgi:hypothetical protein
MQESNIDRWNHQEEDDVPVVDAYGSLDDNHSEQHSKTSTTSTTTGFWKKSRPSTLSLVMKMKPASQRFKILSNFGYSNNELLQSEKHQKRFDVDCCPSSNLLAALLC